MKKLVSLFTPCFNEEENIDALYNEVSKVTVENESKKGQIRIIKVDKDNDGIKLEGVEFEVLDEKGNMLEKIIKN